MAAGSYHNTTSQRTIPTRPVPTSAAVLAYCETHTNAEAAEHFGISDRYVRKLKARAREQQPTTRATLPQDAPSAPNTPPVHSHVTPPANVDPDAPEQTYATVHPSMVARDGQLWKCPKCGELMPPVPGTTGAEWSTRGCYLHQAEPVNFVDYVKLAEPEVERSEEQAEQGRPMEQTNEAIPSAVPARNTEQPVQTPIRNVPPVQVQRVIVRVPAPERKADVLAWMKEPSASRQMVIAAVAFLCLVALTWVG